MKSSAARIKYPHLWGDVHTAVIEQIVSYRPMNTQGDWIVSESALREAAKQVATAACLGHRRYQSGVYPTKG